MLSDRSVLAVCGTAVVRVRDGGLEAVAGGFDGNAHLLAGPDGEPWALSGYGTSFTGECTLALTRLGTRAGDQHRYDIDFPVQIFTAGWLNGLQFFLTGSSVSAVVDLGRGTRITRADWIQSPAQLRAEACRHWSAERGHRSRHLERHRRHPVQH